MIDKERIQLALKGGLVFICATCEHYWMAADRGLEGCGYNDKCGGPLSGNDFPKYKGLNIDWRLFCFVCGKKADFQLRAANSNNGSRPPRILGLCKEHFGKVTKMVEKRGKEIRLKE